MNTSYWLWALAIVLIMLSAAYGIYVRHRVKSTFRQMNRMLDDAINHTFSVSSYDETSLSALESKLNRFLTMSSSSENNLAEEKNRLNSLVSDISHQTKTPITNILLYAELLQEQKNIPEQSRKLAEEIGLQAEKLNFLVQALVKTSRLETGIIKANPRTARVADLLINSIHGVRKKADEKDITLSLSCEEDLLAIFDPKWTEEAMANILDNAVKYTPTGGKVAVSTTVYEMFTRIDISDNGIGIEEQEINQIFMRFYRSPLVSQHEGVGIGLYLTREIINSQGGYIKVKSEPLKGSVFSVFLPNGKG